MDTGDIRAHPPGHVLRRTCAKCPIHAMIRDGTIVARSTGVRVWLTRKLADCIDGVDLSGQEVGDVLELSSRDASLLLAEGHAEPDRRKIVRPSARESLRGQSKQEDAA